MRGVEILEDRSASGDGHVPDEPDGLEGARMIASDVGINREQAARAATDSRRREIFFDVENSSRAEHVVGVIQHLAVDHLDTRTDFFAIGNWRVVSDESARLFAGHGARLLHSALAAGVPDWSDLRIGVAAGVWLGTARAGDRIDLISDDRAFDAVGDIAATLGVAFTRLCYRRLAGRDDGQSRATESLQGGRRRHQRGRTR